MTIMIMIIIHLYIALILWNIQKHFTLKEANELKWRSIKSIKCVRNTKI